MGATPGVRPWAKNSGERSASSCTVQRRRPTGRCTSDSMGDWSSTSPASAHPSSTATQETGRLTHLQLKDLPIYTVDEPAVPGCRGLDQIEDRVVTDPGGQDEVLGQIEMPPPVRDGSLDITLADQVDEPPVGAVGIAVGLDGRG